MANEEDIRPITIKIKSMFRIGEIVYMKTDVKQTPHMIVYIVLRDESVFYGIRYNGLDETEHMDCELSLGPDLTLKNSGINSEE